LSRAIRFRKSVRESVTRIVVDAITTFDIKLTRHHRTIDHHHCSHDLPSTRTVPISGTTLLMHDKTDTIEANESAA
jgi:hypothetical protein